MLLEDSVADEHFTPNFQVMSHQPILQQPSVLEHRLTRKPPVLGGEENKKGVGAV
jgi:hypothetical protein